MSIVQKSKVFIVSLATLAIVAAPMIASAQIDAGTAPTLDLGINYAAAIGLGTRDVRATIADIIRTLMGLLGTVAVVIILYGGFKWMTSQGEEKKTEAAKKLIYAGIIGLIIILSAYAIANFVVGNVLTATK